MLMIDFQKKLAMAQRAVKIKQIEEVKTKKIIYRNEKIQRTQNIQREKTVECPYPYYDMGEDIGKLEKVQVQCGTGPGSWCRFCIHHKRHLFTRKHGSTYANSKLMLLKKIHRREKIKKENLSPSRWKERIASNEKIVSPLGGV